jgi:hypothetical protein
MRRTFLLIFALLFMLNPADNGILAKARFSPPHSPLKAFSASNKPYEPEKLGSWFGLPCEDLRDVLSHYPVQSLTFTAQGDPSQTKER